MVGEDTPADDFWVVVMDIATGGADKAWAGVTVGNGAFGFVSALHTVRHGVSQNLLSIYLTMVYLTMVR